ncbi:DUF5676 family membrane protein [Sideroxydans sp.]|jgi:hypothetical protein
MDKLSLIRTGSTLDVCLFPDGMRGFVNAWTHGLDLPLIRSSKPWTFAELTYEQFGAALTGFLSSVVFAWCYNMVGHCPACSDKPLVSQRKFD